MRLFQLARLNPLGLSDFDSDASAADDDRPLVLFYGDSRARAWPAPALDGVQFENRGINGHSSVQSLLRFDSHVPPLQPDIVIIQVGINDLTAIASLPREAGQLTRATGDNIVSMVEQSRAQGATVVVTTIFPPGRIPLARMPFWSDDIASAIAKVNERLRGLAADGVIVFDTVPVLAGEDGRVLPRYARDELHLNEAGYEALNDALLPMLQEVLAR
jgi:lysophospholipase L1-like esterase